MGVPVDEKRWAGDGDKEEKKGVSFQ